MRPLSILRRHFAVQQTTRRVFFNNNRNYNYHNWIKTGRCFSASATSQMNDIDFKKLTVHKTTSPKKKSPYEELVFGREFSDHMLEIDWYQDKGGWQAPVIRPYGPFSIDPSASVFHYALEAFEGLKAYIDVNDNSKILLFRPEQNVSRLLNSCERLAFPRFNGDEFLKCMYALLRLDKSWIPRKDGYSLYIRPTVISTHPFVGVAPSSQVKLYVILSPVGPYYREGFKAVSLYCTENYVRAWPKGTGANKLGCNYCPTIVPQLEAAKKGYSQVMWLFGDEDYITEVGTMNQFFFWINEKKEKELITCPLDGSILPGVTRDSILKIAREWNEFKVTERPFTMKEVVKASSEGRLLESFGAGTAAIISPVKLINYKGKDYKIPLDPQNPKESAGPLAKRLFKTITDIQYGRIKHPWSVVVPEK